MRSFLKSLQPVTLAAILLSVGAARADNDIVHFSRGALIIPEEGTYQTACGSISAYGLVWRILQSNQAGHYNANHPVTIYWVINGTKGSPNRCVPNNKTAAPSPSSAGPSGDGNNWDDPKWNDGCDATITNSSEQPVVPVPYAAAWPTGGVYPDAAITMLSTTSTYALPAYTAVTGLDNTSTSPRFKTIQYMGGPFIIDAQDAPNVIAFLQNGDSYAPVGSGQTGTLSRYTNACSCTGTSPSSSCHYVQMHQSTIDFTAYVAKRMNQLPPKIALLNAGSGVASGILDDYLDNAGLLVSGTSNHTDSAGCPVGTFSGCNLNGSTSTTQYPGLIYDQFSANEDLISTGTYAHGLLNARDANGKLVYKVFWTPHWVAGTSSYTQYVANGDGAADQRTNALNNIGYFANQKGTGLMAECASLETYEGSYQTGSAPQCGITGVCHGTTTLCNSSVDCAGGLVCETKVCNAGNATHVGQGCSSNSNCGTGGSCNVTPTLKVCDSGTNALGTCSTNADCPGINSGGVSVPVYTSATHFQYTDTITINGLSSSSWDGRNCTDPDYLALTGTKPACTFYPNPGDPFSQLGDFHFIGTGGHVHNYRPNTSASPASDYQSGVKRLAVSWDNYAAGQYPNTQPDPDDGWDLFSLSLKDNDPKKATVIYLAGHSFTGTVPGNRIVLNTLLNLGADPVGSDRALAASVGYSDPNGADAAGTRALIFTPTYEAVTGYPPGADTFVYAQSSKWVFPYTPGHLRTHSLVGGDALVAGESDLGAHTLWDANDAMPAPHDRNVFTYFGGDIALNPSLAGGGQAPHGALQLGWVPENVAGTAINGNYASSPNTGCVDVLKLAKVHDKNHGTDKFGLVAGSDGVCDLQEAAEFSSLNPGSDFGVSENSANTATLLNDLPAVQTMFQRVRGFCAANVGGVDGWNSPILEPNDSQCNDSNQINKAKLGGLVHSSPAVVPASPNVADSGAARPTVAYAGGFDGQLHAFYVSGGSGYTGPAGGLTFNNPNATSKFVTDWASKFASGAVPARGTELWSFLPASQLPLLKGNNARVDSTPVVQDVFIDPGGKGVREWHTILVASIGGTGRELFALDITNPLKPVLLWDLVGSVAQTAGFPWYSPVALANDPAAGSGYAFKWNEASTNFALPPASDPGRAAAGLYDYSDLGASSGLSVAQLRAGLEPVYAVFATSNASGDNAVSKGLEVFAIDAASGQKLWQWEEPYSNSWADNTVPEVASVLGGQDGATKVLVGDMEGRLWELSASTGVNLDTFSGIPGCAGTCKLALFDTQSTAANPQPITTNIAVAQVPANPAAGSALAGYGGATVLIFGTAGADWVSSSAPGNLHVLLFDPINRVPVASGGKHLDGTTWSQAAALAFGQAQGVLQEPGGFPVAMATGEHLYGNITVAGQSVFFETAKGAVGDLMTLSATTAGQTLKIDLGSATAGSPASSLAGFGLANYGGVTVFHNTSGGVSTDYVVGSEVSKLAMMTINNSGATGVASPNAQQAPQGTGANGAYRFMGWLQRLLK